MSKLTLLKLLLFHVAFGSNKNIKHLNVNKVSEDFSVEEVREKVFGFGDILRGKNALVGIKEEKKEERISVSVSEFSSEEQTELKQILENVNWQIDQTLKDMIELIFDQNSDFFTLKAFSDNYSQFFEQADAVIFLKQTGWKDGELESLIKEFSKEKILDEDKKEEESRSTIEKHEKALSGLFQAFKNVSESYKITVNMLGNTNGANIPELLSIFFTNNFPMSPEEKSIKHEEREISLYFRNIVPFSGMLEGMRKELLRVSSHSLNKVFPLFRSAIEEYETRFVDHKEKVEKLSDDLQSLISGENSSKEMKVFASDVKDILILFDDFVSEPLKILKTYLKELEEVVEKKEKVEEILKQTTDSLVQLFGENKTLLIAMNRNKRKKSGASEGRRDI